MRTNKISDTNMSNKKIKKNSLIYIVYFSVVLSLTCYFAILIFEGRLLSFFVSQFDNFEYKEIFTGGFLIKDSIKSDYPLLNELVFDDVLCERVNLENELMEFHDYEYSIDKSNNTFRIIALGDSMTYGWGVRTNESWPKQLERKLNRLYTTNYEVLNFGVPGASIEEKVRVFKECAILYNPDMVILQFFINDGRNMTRIRENARNMYEEYKLGIRELPEELEDLNLTEDGVKKLFSLIAIQEEYRKSLEKLFEENWENVEIPLLDLVNITKSMNIDLIVFAFDRSQQQASSLEKLSKEYNFTFLDLREYIRSEENIRLSDGHLNSRGYDIISDKILEKL